MTNGEWSPQDVLLARRLKGDIYRRSAFQRGRLDRAGLGRRGVERRTDLARLPPMQLDDVPTPSTLLLQSSDDVGRRRRRYWPVRWIRTGDVLLAYSSEDLDRLARLGARVFELAGFSRNDVVVHVQSSAISRDHLQIQLGLANARLVSIALTPACSASELLSLDPSVIVGEVKDVARVVENLPFTTHRVHTVVTVGAAPSQKQRAKLVDKLGAEVVMIRAWAPEGVLAMWAQCRGGNLFHLDHESEIVEVIDPITGLPVVNNAPGVAAWTGVGWHASAVVRLRTDAAVRLVEGICPTCGRASSRVESMAKASSFVEVLDESNVLTTWFAELQRTSEGDGIAVWVCPAAGVSSIDALEVVASAIGNANVNLSNRDEIEAKIFEAKGERFVDRRALPLDAEG